MIFGQNRKHILNVSSGFRKKKNLLGKEDTIGEKIDIHQKVFH
jgi:hypothetical protein